MGRCFSPAFTLIEESLGSLEAVELSGFIAEVAILE